MKNILLLTDFSEASQKAIRFAQTLFEEIPAAFDLLHVYAVDPGVMYGLQMEEAEQNVTRRLHQFLAELPIQPVPEYQSYQCLTAAGNPIRAVEAALEQKPYAYVVVGASGAGLMPVLGSVATGLIRQVKTNVLVVPQHTIIRPIREVVLATDYRSLKQMSCLQPLEELGQLKPIRLTGLSIVDNQTPLLIGEDFEQYRQQMAHRFDSVETGAYQVLDEEVEHGINAYLTTHSVDLLVTVPHRKTLLDTVYNRSLTRRLAYKPRVPLLALYDPEPVGQSPENKEYRWDFPY
ncbi:universal stress protein [Larkinella rosea]|uniref:Universal stress protein n=1 Tax=Larkinella rosea TaxID=2025312 RepID=A0A3P1BFY6_9BACT|nr:universal stress protein [Larkinella rosea]RRA99998.1 universal stress protein [Larkinella rosea]